MNAIEVNGLTKRFGDFVAVDHVSFTVAQGELFGLLGPNGAGKTTLIRMLTTLTPPSDGSAKVAGHDIRKDPNGVRHSIGVIPQALTSDPELTAEENLLIHAKLYGVPASRACEARSTTFWKPSTWGSSRKPWWAHFPEACAAAWRSRAGWCTRPKSFSWMSRPRDSTRSHAPTSGR